MEEGSNKGKQESGGSERALEDDRMENSNGHGSNRDEYRLLVRFLSIQMNPITTEVFPRNLFIPYGS